MVYSFNSENLILNQLELIDFRNECAKNGLKVVFSSGVYDILHVGHLRSLENSRKYGDVLIVGINDDIFAKSKGANRPIHNEKDRAALIAGFKVVSCVHIFNKSNLEVLQVLKPDVYIMSRTSNKKPEDRGEEFEFMNSIGGKVLIFDGFSDRHSTKIIDNIGSKYN